MFKFAPSITISVESIVVLILLLKSFHVLI
jgi:hypothetical protein